MFNVSRLDLARRRRGFTKVALAEASGIALRTLAAYDAHTRAPGDETVARFAEVLEFPSEFFFGPSLEEPSIAGSSFRSLTSLSAQRRDKALAAGTLAMALSDWIHSRFTLPDPAIPTYQGVDPETAAMAVRTEWGLGEKPIGHMLNLLEAQGIRIFSLTEDTAAMDAFSFWRGELPYVFLNTMKSAERSRMDAAHELGHLVLHWRGDAHGRDAEREADLFGSAFLMPRGSVIAEAPRTGRLDDLIQAKQRWNVSLANLIYRMHKLGLMSDWQYRMLFIEIGRKNYRTNEPHGSPGETSQVLAKVFASLREERMPMSQVARRLNILPAELSSLVFGLVLTPIVGGGNANDAASEEPELRLV